MKACAHSRRDPPSSFSRRSKIDAWRRDHSLTPKDRPSAGRIRSFVNKSVAFDRANRMDEKHRAALGIWAAKCAERVLPIFETKRPRDKRVRAAIEAIKA